MAETKVDPQEVKEAVDALRSSFEKFGAESADYKQMMEKTNAIIEKQEKESQDIVKKLNESLQSQLDMKERVKDLELELSKKAGNTGVNYKDQPEYKALQKWFCGGEKAVEGAGLDVKTLRMDTDTAGGVLTTTEMDTVITKNITEISPVRQVARVRTVTKKTLDMPTRTGIPTATYEGEAQTGSESQSAYGSEQLTAYRLTVTVPFTLDLLNDASFDLEAEINNDVSEAFAFKEGNKFVLGTGAKQPEGFLVHPTIVAGARETAGSGVIAGDDILLLTGDLKVGYNPMFGFNRQTLATLRTLKDSAGAYLWQHNMNGNRGIAGAAFNTLAGEPYIVMQDMPAITSGALSVIYGDFMRGYTIIDRTGMVIIRDEVTSKKSAIVEMTFHKWNHGQVTLAEAFKALKIKA